MLSRLAVEQAADGAPVERGGSGSVVKHLIWPASRDAGRGYYVAATALEIQVVVRQPAATLLGAGKVHVETAARSPDERAGTVEEAGPLQAVECRPAVTVRPYIDIENIKTRVSGRYCRVPFRHGTPPGLDKPLIGGRVLEPVRRVRLL